MNISEKIVKNKGIIKASHPLIKKVFRKLLKKVTLEERKKIREYLGKDY